MFISYSPHRKGFSPMRQGMRSLLTAAAGAALAALISIAVVPVAGQQAATYRAPRAADGHPDLNGIWQALNEANYDVEMHMARPPRQTRPGRYARVPAPPVLAIGAVGAVPPGVGVVEGDI